MQCKLEEGEEDDSGEEDELEDVVSNSIVFGKKHMVSLNDEYLEITERAWKILFDQVISPTIKHIKRLLDEPKLMRKCKYLCLVGGLSTSPYFQRRMDEEFGARSRYKLRVIIPQRPILSVVEGAAYLGITPNYIKARVLRYSYGSVCVDNVDRALLAGVPRSYVNKHKYWCAYMQEYQVDGLFDAIASKNQEIHIGDVLSVSGQRFTPSESEATIEIMVSDMEQPKVVSEGRALGKVKVYWEKSKQDKDDMEFTIEFHFYETMIKTVCYRKTQPHIKTIGYVTNY